MFWSLAMEFPYGVVPPCPRPASATPLAETCKDLRNVSTSWASATTGALGAPSAMAIMLDLRLELVLANCC